MKEIALTKGAVALVDDNVYDFLNSWSWQLGSNGYAVRTESVDNSVKPVRRQILMHRVIYEYVNSSIPDKLEIDHINKNKLDNHISNLKLCTHLENCNNRNVDNKTHYKGVTYQNYIYKKGKKYPRRKPYQAKIMINGVRKSLGFFETAEEAGAAYNKAYLEMTSTLVGAILSEQVAS